jgi:hypothetical protein
MAIGSGIFSWLARYDRRIIITIGVIAVLLLAARIALPHVIQRYVNNKLAVSEEYAGQVGDIDLSLIQGAYSIENVEVEKTTGAVPVPLFAAREIKFSVLWKALFNGAVVGDAELFEPVINIVDSKDESKEQKVDDGRWIAIADELFPLRIDQVLIHQGQLHFQNFDIEPPIDIYLSQIEGNARNISNRQALSDSPIGHLELTALAMESSDLALTAAIDSSRDEPTFDLNLKLLALQMSHLDAFIKTYAPFDIEAGSMDVVTELAARDGMLEGYLKPIIYNLVVLDWREDVEKDKDNPLKVLWEGLVGAIAELLENQPRDQLATSIPIDGDLSNPETSVLTTIANILRNAFVEAFQANLENTISLFEDEEEMPAPLPTPLEPATGESAEATADETPESQ